ncbi:MAG: PQQ-binding-like beta-propeller repeat protein [Candidatus Neomarinimicrobiota bacterium]
MVTYLLHRPTRYAALLLVYLLVGCSRGPRVSPEELAEPYRSARLFSTPELAWQSKLPTPPTALLPLSSHVLLVTTHRGELYRFNLTSGKRDGPIRQPFRKAITAQLVYAEGPYLYIASAWEKELRAYDLIQGKLHWKRKANDITGPLALAKGLLLTASVTGEVAAYDTTQGRPIWRRRIPGRIYQGVQISDSLALVLNDSGTLYAFVLHPPRDQANLPEEDYPPVWHQKLPVSPSAVVATGAGRLIIADTYGRLFGIDPTSGETIFQVQLKAPIYSQPLVTSTLVVVATAAGEVFAFQGSDGSQVWRFQGEGLIKCPLLTAADQESGVVLVPFARGQILALDLATGKELWRYDMERPIEIISLTTNGIVIADRRNELSYLRAVDSTTHMPK